MALWPIGTTATASTFHASWVTPTPGCPQRCFWTYGPANAIDRNTTTFWNDDTLGTFPDSLYLNFPTSSPVNLTGIQVFSNDDGYITAYDIYISVSSSAPFKAASVTGIASAFSQPSSWNVGISYIDSRGIISGITALEIRVNSAQGDAGQQYTRIGEVYPLYGAAAAAAASSSSSSSSSRSTIVSTDTGSPLETNTVPAHPSATASKSLGSSLKTYPITPEIMGGIAGTIALAVTVIYFV